jgi:hypothetical protein
MSRHAIVDRDNKVVNVVVWEGAEWLPPRNHLVVHCGDRQCDIGDTYMPSDNSFCRPKVKLDAE